MPSITAMKPITIPLHIVYVMDDSNTYDQDILDYCADNGFRFTSRPFNSQKYSDDRYNISQLPALHVYLKNGYKDTLYPSSKIFDSIEKHVDYERRCEDKKKGYDFFKLMIRSPSKESLETPKIH